MDRLARSVLTLEPVSPAEERVLPDLVEHVDEILDARRHRLFQGQQGVGAPMWIVVLVGGAITLGFAAFFRMERLGIQLLLTGLVGGMFGLMLFLIVAMDHPLWGRMGVSPEPFQEQLERSFIRMQREQGGSGGPAGVVPGG